MKKLFLEFIRGAAAITVLIYHFLELHTLGTHSNHFYLSNWGTDAVIIFFILSGIVINISQTHNPKSKKEFIAGRLIRLYPQLIVGLLLGILVLYVTGSTVPSARVIIGNFFMISALQGYMNNIVPCIESNSPLWSLSFEIVFYLLFALSIGRNQKKILGYWFLISIAVMPLYYLNIGNDVIKHILSVISFSSIWLAGYFMYQYRHYFYADKYTALFSLGVLPLISRMHLAAIYYDPAKYLLFAVFAIPFFRYCLQLPARGKKISVIYLLPVYLVIVYTVFRQPYLTFTNFAIYSALPIALAALGYMIISLNLQKHFLEAIRGGGSLLGKYSYSVYITHYPVLFFCAAFFHSLSAYLLISFTTIFFIAYSLETWLQPAVVIYYNKLKVLYRNAGKGFEISFFSPDALNTAFIPVPFEPAIVNEFDKSKALAGIEDTK